MPQHAPAPLPRSRQRAPHEPPQYPVPTQRPHDLIDDVLPFAAATRSRHTRPLLSGRGRRRLALFVAREEKAPEIRQGEEGVGAARVCGDELDSLLGEGEGGG